MTIYIIGDKEKFKYKDPDEVAEAMNRAYEEEQRRRALEEKLRGKTGIEKKATETPEAESQYKIPSLEELCKGYEEFMSWDNKVGVIPTSITSKLNPTKEQIEEFSRILPEYKDFEGFRFCTAYYLTALMLSSKDEEFTLDMEPLNQEGILLDCLGRKLEKKKLKIKGNAGDSVGHGAKNCPITVEGNAGDCVGNCAKNCPITVEGNAGDWVGSGAENCDIYIKGSYTSLSNHIGKGMKVYQWKNNKWKKVYEK